MGAEEVVEQTGVNVPAPDLNGPQMSGSINFMDKYGEERNKRLGGDTNRQYIDLRTSDELKHFLEDPWVKSGTPVNRPVPDGGHVKAVIVGAGFGGILFAVKLIEAGYKAADLLLVDTASSFGGTWCWNRYPGLMCDTESYIYLPLLETMNYMPRDKYATGDEIRNHSEAIATKYGLHPRGQFQSAVQSARWDESTSKWLVTIQERPKGGSPAKITIHADNVLFASGLLSNAKLPNMDIEQFRGHQFHTSRWDYDYTGGSPEHPELTRLKNKKIAYIGTGATAVQSIPHLAAWAKELYVFQRTPSAVDRRDNRKTDPEKWQSEIANGPGWQRARSANFHAFVCNHEKTPEVNLINDRWTQMPSYSALVGGPRKVTMENVAEHVGNLHALDYLRSEAVRKRAEEIVEDQETARALQAWYPGWCKRPCFHDEYLQAFNSPNVQLINTAGKGIDTIFKSGVVFDGQEYRVDAIVWGTGFISPLAGTAADKAAVEVVGKHGVSLEERGAAGDLSTLHGVVSRDFPNMWWPGPLQAGVSPNQIFVLDQMSTHIAHIITEGQRRSDGGRVTIEPSQEAQDAWAIQIAMEAPTFAAMSGCTPGYLNMEGEVDKIPPEARMKMASQSVWGLGIESFVKVLEEWRENGGLEGLEVTSVA